MKILPLGEFNYQVFPLTGKGGKPLDGVIEISDTDFAQIGKTLRFNAEKTALIPFDGSIVEKERAARQTRQKRIAELTNILTAYTKDFAQAVAGVYISDIEERKAKFRAAHAELRQLEGKGPRC